jgi:DNA replication protein DnaC
MNTTVFSELDNALVRATRLTESSYQTKRLYTLKARKDVVGLDDAIKAVTAMVNGEMDMPLVLLVSTPGLGKTHLAQAAVWMMIDNYKTATFYKVVNLLDELKRGYEVSGKSWDQQGTDRTYEQIMSWLQRVGLLVLDDIGVEKMTDWSGEKIDQIIDNRYSNNLPLLLTSNTMELPPRIVSRCKEGRIVILKGTDYRGIKGVKNDK